MKPPSFRLMTVARIALMSVAALVATGSRAELANVVSGFGADSCDAANRQSVMVGALAGAGARQNSSVMVGPLAGAYSSGENNVFIGFAEGAGLDASDTTSINGRQLFISHDPDAYDEETGEYGTNSVFALNPVRNQAVTNAPLWYRNGTLHINAKAVFGDAESGLSLLQRKTATEDVETFPATSATTYRCESGGGYSNVTGLGGGYVLATNAVLKTLLSQTGEVRSRRLSFTLVFNHLYAATTASGTWSRESDRPLRGAYRLETYTVADWELPPVGEYTVSPPFLSSDWEGGTNIIVSVSAVSNNVVSVRTVPESVGVEQGQFSSAVAGVPGRDELYADVATIDLDAPGLRYAYEPCDLAPFVDLSVSTNNALVTSGAVKAYVDSAAYDVGEAKAADLAFDLYLAPYGDDENDGLSPDHPKRTIEGCYRAAGTNAVVCVFPGDYGTISNERGAEYSLYYPPHDLTFVAVGGRARTSITGRYTSDAVNANGYHHTLAFSSGPQRFVGFTIRRLSGWSTSVGQPGGSSNSPAMSCVALEDCAVEDCDVNFWLSFGAVNCCAFSNTVFRNVNFRNYGSGNPPGVFIQCEFRDCRVESGTLLNLVENRPIYFFENCEASGTVFSLPPVLDSEYGNGGRRSTFEDCTFVWDFDPSRRARVWPAHCTNCYFCVGTGYGGVDGTNGVDNVFAPSWTNAYLDADFVAASIDCPAVRTDGAKDAGWRDSGLGELKAVGARANAAGTEGDNLVRYGGRIGGSLTVGQTECMDGYQAELGREWKGDETNHVERLKLTVVRGDRERSVEMRHDGTVEMVDEERSLRFRYRLPERSGTFVVDGALADGLADKADRERIAYAQDSYWVCDWDGTVLRRAADEPSVELWDVAGSTFVSSDEKDYAVWRTNSNYDGLYRWVCVFDNKSARDWFAIDADTLDFGDGYTLTRHWFDRPTATNTVVYSDELADSVLDATQTLRLELTNSLHEAISEVSTAVETKADAYRVSYRDGKKTGYRWEYDRNGNLGVTGVMPSEEGTLYEFEFSGDGLRLYHYSGSEVWNLADLETFSTISTLTAPDDAETLAFDSGATFTKAWEYEQIPVTNTVVYADALYSALGGCTLGFADGAFCVYTNGVKAGTLTFTPLSAE